LVKICLLHKKGLLELLNCERHRRAADPSQNLARLSTGYVIGKLVTDSLKNPLISKTCYQSMLLTGMLWHTRYEDQ
jgi:hypothetical protein